MAVAAVVRDHCLAPERVDAPIGEGGRYGWMFGLPALDADEALLHRLGAAGGFCDGGDCEGDARVEAGWPFFGQYVAHDLTADRSPLRAHADLGALRNVRSPRANLESLYGGGPVGSPYLSTGATTRRSCSRTTATCRETRRASRSSATPATTSTPS